MDGEPSSDDGADEVTARVVRGDAGEERGGVVDGAGVPLIRTLGELERHLGGVGRRLEVGNEALERI